MVWLATALGLKGSAKRRCPFCGHHYFCREQRKGLRVRTACLLLAARPYRCLNCDNLFLAPALPRQNPTVVARPAVKPAYKNVES